MYDLSICGLGRKRIKTDLSDLNTNLPNWQVLPVLRSNSLEIPGFWLLEKPLQDLSNNYWMPAFHWDTYISSGSYGKIFKGLRIIYKPTYDNGKINSSLALHGKAENIVLKEVLIAANQTNELTEKCVTSIIYEAVIHSLTNQLFNKLSWDFAVPKLHEVFVKYKGPKRELQNIDSVTCCMEYVRGQTLFDFLRRQLRDSICVENDILYLRILGELALLVKQVQDHLRMNHRDLKVNNVLIRTVPEKNINIFTNYYPNLKQFDTYNYNLVLIDYGFSCIACGDEHDPPEASMLDTGSWFGPTDSCFKSGRDLCQFIYCMECYYPRNKHFTKHLTTLIEQWLTVPYMDGIAHLFKGIHKNGMPYLEQTNPLFHTGIYEFLRREEVNPNMCTPSKILKNIENYFL